MRRKKTELVVCFLLAVSEEKFIRGNHSDAAIAIAIAIEPAIVYLCFNLNQIEELESGSRGGGGGRNIFPSMSACASACLSAYMSEVL